MDPHRIHEAPPPGYVTQSPDTTYWVERAQFEHWASLDDRECVAFARDLHRSAHRLVIAGLREQYPDASPRELEIRAAELRAGAELVRRLLALDADAPRGPGTE